ncbi:cilia- and flagella-associated protein 251-like [Cardiocondyla obscurior]|uniref:cilia- and flagella-associated protein 251-like n=1 Tax=Cardiocondyla obscurior TaxID=286306 RepID=UPI003965600B
MSEKKEIEEKEKMELELEGKKEIEGGEEKKKKGLERPPRVEMLGRERSNCLPIKLAFRMGEKRKGRQEDKEEKIKIEGFKKSCKIGRSPVKGDEGKGKERDYEEEGTSKDRFEEVIKEVRNGFEKLNKQMEEVKECKAQSKKEIKELKRMWNREKIALEEKLDKRLKEIKKKSE